MHPTPTALVLSVIALLFSPASAQESPPPPRAAGAIGALVGAVQAGDVNAVQTLRDAAGPLGARIATWRILRDGIAGDLATFQTFYATHADWPGMDLLRRRAEERVSGASAQTVLAWFAEQPPQTADGYLALIDATLATGQDAAPLVQDLWLTQDLTEAQESTLLARFADQLRPLHARRLDDLLWRGQRAQAERMIPRVDAGQAALARARLALQARADGVDAMVSAVPAALRTDPGLSHDRFRWRLSRGLTDSAAELMREVSPDGLGRPEVWAAQRARLARRAMAEGSYPLAYDLAANHGLTDGAQWADLEWLAGYVALRFLDRPQDAQRHFSGLRGRVSSPISLGRAGYWEGRALEAMGRAEDARQAYAFGARFQTAFYGLLAAERLGQTLDPAVVANPRYPMWQDTRLAQSDLLQAALLLHDGRQWSEARRFTLQLASQLQTEEELGALAQLWLDRGEPHFALRIAKLAVQKGILLPRAYFPVTFLAEADLRVAPDLALSIARRESEFNEAVISSADARGLMQVLPATGRQTARRMGVEFDETRLTTDGAYNATLGAGYLEEMMAEFGNTLPLVAAGYNAGPGRPRRWVTEFGDPRNADTDPIDWVEFIPFTETRNYVMRVAEAVVLYRAILAGEPGPIRLTDILRGRG